MVTGSHLGLRPNQEGWNCWARDVCGGEKCAHGVVMGKGEGKNYLEDLDLDGRIVLRCILMK